MSYTTKKPENPKVTGRTVKERLYYEGLSEFDVTSDASKSGLEYDKVYDRLRIRIDRSVESPLLVKLKEALQLVTNARADYVSIACAARTGDKSYEKARSKCLLCRKIIDELDAAIFMAQNLD